MALLFWDSFDHYATANVLEKYIEQSALSLVIGAIGRFGTNGLRLEAATIAHGRLRGPVKGYPQTVTVGFAIYLPVLVTVGSREILSLMDGGTDQLALSVVNDGSLKVTRGYYDGPLLGASAAGVIAAATWYYIELQATIDNAVGSAEVRVTEVDGTETTVINVAGVDTQMSSAAQVSMFELGGAGYNNGNFFLWFDDLYVLDDVGAQCNDFLQDTRVCCLPADGVGAHADWTPSVGPANWQDVDEIPPDDDATYNYTLTPTDRDSFSMEDLPVTAVGPIQAVCAVVDHRKDDAGTRTIQPAVRTGGIDYDGTGPNSPNDYAFHTMYAWEVNPDTTVAWLRAEVNAIEAGYELVA